MVRPEDSDNVAKRIMNMNKNLYWILLYIYRRTIPKIPDGFLQKYIFRLPQFIETLKFSLSKEYGKSQLKWISIITPR